MKLNLKIWRQQNAGTEGKVVDYMLDDVSPDMSFLEMLDVLNEKLIVKGEEPVAFDHDCREGICGACSLMINGVPHGPEKATTTCQLHMRKFNDGDEITIEPWRAGACRGLPRPPAWWAPARRRTGRAPAPGRGCPARRRGAGTGPRRRRVGCRPPAASARRPRPAWASPGPARRGRRPRPG